MAQFVGASSHRPKGCGFDSWSGLIPRLWAPSLVGARMEGNRSMFLSHSNGCICLSVCHPLSLPLSLKSINSPGWYRSVDWVLAWEPKGRWFDSQPGHMPGLQARPPVRGTHERQPHTDVSLLLFLPYLTLSLKINKSNIKINKYILEGGLKNMYLFINPDPPLISSH